jgi:hypothetical protein
MKINIKAMLLSAFLLPGIGQLYKGDKGKGVFFLVIVNMLMLAALFIALRKMGGFLMTARVSGPAEAMQLLDSITRNSPEIGWLLTGFALVWGAAAVDAALARPAAEQVAPVENV